MLANYYIRNDMQYLGLSLNFMSVNSMGSLLNTQQSYHCANIAHLDRDAQCDV